MGRFPEMNQLHRTGGKLFDADDNLVPASDSIIFPAVKCFTADGKEHNFVQILRGKVTCVTVFMRDFARPMLNSWEEQIDEVKQEYPQLQVREIRTSSSRAVDRSECHGRWFSSRSWRGWPTG